MKFLIMLGILLMSSVSFAEDLCEMNLRIDEEYTYLSENQVAKIYKIVASKNYNISNNPSAPYQAKIMRYFGFDCGTGLTRWDTLIRVPSGYEISFKGPDVVFEKQESFQGISKLVERKSFRKLKAELRDLPNCPYAE